MPTPHESHMAHAKRRGLAVPCTAYHVNYGGGCLNCGWLPATPPTSPQDARTPEDDPKGSPPHSAQGASVERVRMRFCPKCDGNTYVGRIGTDGRTCPTCAGRGLIPDWGKPYGIPQRLPDGSRAYLSRRGQRCRWYDRNGAQIGPEQSNVAPALAYAIHNGWSTDD